MDSSKTKVTIVVENIEEIKAIINETEDLISALKANIKKLDDMGFKFTAKRNK